MMRIFYNDLFEELCDSFEQRWNSFLEQTSNNTNEVEASEIFKKCDKHALNIVTEYKNGGKVISSGNQRGAQPIYENIDGVVFDSFTQCIETFDDYASNKARVVMWYDLIRSDTDLKYTNIYFPLSREHFYWGKHLFELNLKLQGCMSMIRAVELMSWCINGDDSLISNESWEYINKIESEKISEISSENAKKGWRDVYRAHDYFIKLLGEYKGDDALITKTSIVTKFLPHMTRYINEHPILLRKDENNTPVYLSEDNLYENIYYRWSKVPEVKKAIEAVRLKAIKASKSNTSLE